MPDNLSKRNIKHISKHLQEFQKYDATLTLNDIITLGSKIVENSENLIYISGERQIFEQTLNIGKQMIRVRVVLNPQGNLRSIHIRY